MKFTPVPGLHAPFHTPIAHPIARTFPRTADRLASSADDIAGKLRAEPGSVDGQHTAIASLGGDLEALAQRSTNAGTRDVAGAKALTSQASALDFLLAARDAPMSRSFTEGRLFPVLDQIRSTLRQ